MTKLKFYSLYLGVALALAGCAARPMHPGAVNKFDSDSYDAILVTENLIESTKTELTNNAFPPTVAANVKTALNTLIQTYNVADVAYQAYHTALLGGSATPAQQAAVSSSLSNVATSTTTLMNSKKGS